MPLVKYSEIRFNYGALFRQNESYLYVTRLKISYRNAVAAEIVGSEVSVLRKVVQLNLGVALRWGVEWREKISREGRRNVRKGNSSMRRAPVNIREPKTCPATLTFRVHRYNFIN